VDKTILGFETTTTFYQAVNPGFIMIFAPLFAMLWVWLGRRHMDPPAPFKFALGLALLGSGFLVLNTGRPFVHAGMMPAIFLVLLYFLHTMGELVLSPVGLSLVTKLAPPRIVGLMFGFWFLSSSIGIQAGKWIANLTAVDEGTTATAEETLNMALGVFNKVGLFAIGAAVLLLLLSRQITRWMHGVDKAAPDVEREGTAAELA
jgi:proton-dependent oligopeptide transporter, POT family